MTHVTLIPSGANCLVQAVTATNFPCVINQVVHTRGKTPIEDSPPPFCRLFHLSSNLLVTLFVTLIIALVYFYVHVIDISRERYVFISLDYNLYSYIVAVFEVFTLSQGLTCRQHG